MGFFCQEFLSCVVGRLEWKKQIERKRVWEIASASDEAFALLALENIWDDVVNHVEKGPTAARDPIVGKYTVDKYKRAGKYGGWSVAGLHRMLELKRMVEENRKEFPNADDEYLEFVNSPAYGGRTEKENAKRQNDYAGLELSGMDDFESWPV